MGRQRENGLNRTWVKRSNGTRVAYYYDRETKKFLGHDEAEALAKLEIMRAPPPPKPKEEFPEGSLGWLIDRYLRPGGKFSRLKEGTQKLYRGYLKQMKADWGDLPLSGIKPSVIEDIKIQLRETPAKANQTLALFRILLGYAVDMEFIDRNAALRPGRLPPPKRHHVWDDTEVDRFLAAAPDNIRLAMGLLLHTVQRPSDMLAMTLAQVIDREGRLWISLRQAKTDNWVNVPVHTRLEPLLRDRMAQARATLQSDKEEKAANGKTRFNNLLLVPSPEGMLWGKRNFARAWDRALRNANFRLAKQLLAAKWSKQQIRDELAARHRQRRDLRRTGIVRMAEAGATVPQIAAVSGHSIHYCTKILDTYLPRRSEVALGAILAWERQGDANRSTVRIADYAVPPPPEAPPRGAKMNRLPAVAGGGFLHNKETAADPIRRKR